MPLFTNVLEEVFSEVHIQDAGCQGVETVRRRTNLLSIAPVPQASCYANG